MVSTEILEVVIRAKDELSKTVNDMNNKLKSTGTTAKTAMDNTRNASNQARNALNSQNTAIDSVKNKYNSLKTTVSTAFNTIRNTITNSNPAKYLNASSLAEPFKNAAETIKGKWQSMMQYIRGTKAKPNIDTSSITPAEAKVERLIGTINRINATRASPRFDLTTMQSADGKIKVILKDLESLRGYKVNLNVGSSGSELNNLLTMVDKVQQRANKLNNTTVTPKISPAGLATLNGEVSRSGQIVQQLQGRFGSLGSVLSSAFMKANTAVVSFKGKLSGIKDKLGGLTGSLGMLQGTIMSAFGAVGVTSLTQFTLGAAAARQKINAVTTSITGSKAATQSLNKSISAATSGGVVGFNNVAKAVQQIGLKYNLSNAQLEKTPPLLNKIGTYALAMGKDSSTAAQWMATAYDGLNGNFRVLKRQLGITKEQLIDNGWSGAASDVDGYTRALEKCLDKKPEMQEYLNSYEGQMMRLKMAVAGAGRQIGEIFLPILNWLLGTFLDINQKAPWLTTAVVLLAVAFVGVASAAMILLPILEILAIEINQVTIAQRILNIVSLSNPWFLVAVAIIAVIAVLAYLYTNVDSVRKIMDSCAATIRNTLVKAWETLQKIIAPLYPTLEHLGQVFQRLAEKLGWNTEKGGALEAVIWLLCKAFEAVVFVLVKWWSFLAAVFIPVLNLLINIFSAIINFAISLAEAFSLLAQGDFNGFITALLDAFATLGTDILTYLGEFVIELLNSVGTVLLGADGMIGEWLLTFITNGVNGAIAFVTGFVTQIMMLPGQIWIWLNVTITNIAYFIITVINNMRNGALNAVNGFVSFISTLPSRTWTWLMNVVNRIISFASTAASNMRNAAQRIYQSFKDKVQQLPQVIWDELVHVKDNILNGIGMVVDAIRQLANRIVDKFKETLHIKSPGLIAQLTEGEMNYTQEKIQNATNPIASAMENVGANMINGFNNNDFSTLQDTVTSALPSQITQSTDVLTDINAQTTTTDETSTENQNSPLSAITGQDTALLTENITQMSETVTPLLDSLSLSISQLGMSSTSNTALMINNNLNNTLSYQQMQQQISFAMQTLKTHNTTAWNNIKTVTLNNLNSILTSTKTVTSQMISAWKTMKDSIIQAATDIRTQSESRFNHLWSTIKTFYNRIQHPGGAGSPNLSSRRSTGSSHNAFSSFKNAVNNRLGNKNITLNRKLLTDKGFNKEEIEYILPSVNSTVKNSDLHNYINKLTKAGAGGWSSVVSPNVNWIRNTTNKWDTAPPTIVHYRTSHGFKVEDFENGEPSVSFNEFRQIAEDVFSQCHYLFYMDSDWYGNWIAAARAGWMNCSDSTDFILAMARAFGLSGTKVHGYWNNIGHFWANIEGHKMDTTGWMNRRTWTPSASHSGPVPRGLTLKEDSDNTTLILELLGLIYDLLKNKENKQESLEVIHKGDVNYKFEHEIEGTLAENLNENDIVNIMDAHVEDSKFLKILTSNREFQSRFKRVSDKLNGENERFS